MAESGGYIGLKLQGKLNQDKVSCHKDFAEFLYLYRPNLIKLNPQKECQEVTSLDFCIVIVEMGVLII